MALITTRSRALAALFSFSIATGGLVCLVGCGGAAPPPATATTPAPTTTTSTAAPEPTAPAALPEQAASVVRFDDLGISMTIPPGLRAVGDDEIAARVRASASPKVRDLIRARVAQKHALPLLTLAKDADASHVDTWLTVTLSVVGVPADTTADEMMDQQRTVMAKHLDGFDITSPAAPVALDGVTGSAMAGHYKVRRGGDLRPVASENRAFVRDGLAYLLVAVWSEGETESAAQAKAVFGGLHFYAPQP